MSRFLASAAPLAVIALGGIGLASAQSSSPFASKKPRQAWEQPAAPAPTPQPAPVQTYQAPAYTPPAYDAPIQTAPPQTRATKPAYQPSYEGGRSTPPTETPNYGRPTAAPAPQYSASPTAPSSRAYPQTRPSGQAAPSQYGTPQLQQYGQPYAQQPNYGQTPQYGQQYAQTSYPPQGGQPFPAPQQPQTWKQKLGLDKIATFFSGGLRSGAALSYRDVPPHQVGAEDGYSEDFIIDADVEFEASAITQGGLEYGVNLGARAQYDPYRRGFGGRIPTCTPGIAGCNASGGSTLRGHTSQFYQFGEDTAKDAQFAVESAHLFLRSAYGDVTVGRDDGAAFLFSLGAPTLLAVNASNSPVDYTGLDSVKTVNDASSFSEKITYTSPRLLGDQIGVGVQFGVSYALDAEACGVDFCTDRDVARVIAPELEDVFEAGLALDRTFANGLSVEGTLTYATATEKSGFAGLDDLESYGAGLEFEYADWTLGGSYLQSNNGLLDGDYSAYDIGVTWKPSALGFSLAYGHAEDDNVGLTSDQGTFGVTYDFDRFTLGTGVQYVDRTVTGLIPQGGGVFNAGELDQKGTSVFVEAAVKF